MTKLSLRSDQASKKSGWKGALTSARKRTEIAACGDRSEGLNWYSFNSARLAKGSYVSLDSWSCTALYCQFPLSVNGSVSDLEIVLEQVTVCTITFFSRGFIAWLTQNALDGL